MYSSVNVAPNEPVIGAVMDRSIVELNRNDISLDALNKIVFSKIGISDYLAANTYGPGQLVWYNDKNGNLFLLRCIKENNTTPPNVQANDPLSDVFLNQSGWENQNRNLTILDYGILELLSANSAESIISHEDDASMHPYGKVSTDPDSPYSIEDKILKSSMSNLNYSTQKVFFPTLVKRLDSGDAVVTGYMRKFSNKIVEYDIILKLASRGIVDYTSVFDYSKTLSANTATFQLYAGLGAQSTNFQANSAYFATTSDMDMFAPEESNMQSRCGLLLQLKRNDYVNTYSADILFPDAFSDLNYMVFSNSVLSQAIGDSKTLVPSANDISWCNKTRKSITLLDITFPDSTKYGIDGYNATHGGLAANSFHCKVIGKIG